MAKRRENPVYEKLAPKECLIVSRDAEGFTCNLQTRPLLQGGEGRDRIGDRSCAQGSGPRAQTLNRCSRTP